MKASVALRFLWIAIMIGGFALPNSLAKSQQYPEKPDGDQPPILQGGEWTDDFLGANIFEPYNTYNHWGHLILKTVEILDWTQTWTAHFASGEFFQTEAISDSVRLAPNGLGRYYTTGVYTSTVMDAGKQVDWLASEWKHSGIYYSVTIEFRTGNTSNPDLTWSDWSLPKIAMNEFYCMYLIDLDTTECGSNMGGIESSRFIQYRASFSNDNPAQTISLEDIKLYYGVHTVTGTATSELLSPIDLLAWDSVIISSTVPLSTSLVIDILASDGMTLIPNVSSGQSLASIDPHEHPSIQLHATFSTSDGSLTPDLDLWGIHWLVIPKLYLPALFR